MVPVGAATDEVTVDAEAAIGIWVAVMPDKPELPEIELQVHECVEGSYTSAWPDAAHVGIVTAVGAAAPPEAFMTTVSATCVARAVNAIPLLGALALSCV